MNGLSGHQYAAGAGAPSQARGMRSTYSREFGGDPRLGAKPQNLAVAQKDIRRRRAAERRADFRKRLQDRMPDRTPSG